MLLAVHGVLWLAASLLQSLFPVSHGLLLQVSVCVFLAYKDISHNKGSMLLQYDLILTYILIISAKTLFPNEVPFAGTMG